MNRQIHIQRGLLILIFCGVAARGLQAAATAVYISQNGGGDGSSCGSPQSISFFNSSANWGSGSSQIGPGTTVHLCGTFTGAAGSTMLTFHGSGTSGNPITLLFESGAVLTAPYWGSEGAGAITASGQSYLVIDGGTNGLITATANGTTLANQLASDGIYIGSCNNSEIRNVTVSNMYVRTPNSSDAPADSHGIFISQGNNVLIDHNTIHDAAYGVWFQFDAGTSNSQVYSNTISHTATGIVYGSMSTGATAANVLLHDNEIFDNYFWDSPADAFHCDGIHIWEYGSSLTGLQMYNNYIHGNNGVHNTGLLFMEGNVPNSLLYNNILEADPGNNPADGFIYIKEPTNAGIYNNTFIGNGGGVAFESGSGGGHKLKNNVIVNVDYSFYTPGGDTTIATDYNVFFGVNNWGASFEPFTQWQSAGQDAHGKNGSDTKLSAAFKPQTGSAAIGAATNLTSLGITALNSDRSGSARPASGVWDAGAYQLSSGVGSVSPCDTNGDGKVDVSDTQLQVNMALKISNCINSDSQCTVVQVQRVANAVLGQMCVSP